MRWPLLLAATAAGGAAACVLAYTRYGGRHRARSAWEAVENADQEYDAEDEEVVAAFQVSSALRCRLVSLSFYFLRMSGMCDDKSGVAGRLCLGGCLRTTLPEQHEAGSVCVLQASVSWSVQIQSTCALRRSGQSQMVRQTSLVWSHLIIVAYNKYFVQFVRRRYVQHS